jgi:hypothetical protein
MVTPLQILKRVWIVYFFVATIFLGNLLLLLGLLLRVAHLLSDRNYRQLANWFTGTTWCFYPKVFEEEARGKVMLYGEQPPKNAEHVLVMANHIEAPDWSENGAQCCAGG